jgi:hypothetical protein
MTLHVTNGDSVGGTLRETALGGDVLVWRDVLHEWPLPERDDTQLLEADHVVLWFEHDLYDQLQLIDILSIRGDVELIVAGAFLGPMSAAELQALWPSRTKATPEIVRAATGAWDAVRSPEPTGLLRDVPELPYLGPALRRLLEELPSTHDGLSRTERGALQTRGDFVAAQQLEEAPFLGDTWFFDIVAELRPLAENEELRSAVLRGDADRVELLGIDRWVGGTHVTPDNLWRWDGAKPVRTR